MKVIKFYDEEKTSSWREGRDSLDIAAHEGHLNIVQALLDRKHLFTKITSLYLLSVSSSLVPLNHHPSWVNILNRSKNLRTGESGNLSLAVAAR